MSASRTVSGYAIGSGEAVIHAAELIGAIKMMRRWELKLRKISSARAAEQEG